MACRLHQTSHRCCTSGESGEFVDIVLQELVREELGCRALQNLIGHGSCEEQGRWIGGGEKEHIDGDHLAQALDHFDPQRPGVKPGMTQPDDLTSDPLCAWLVHRSAPACSVLLLTIPLS